jgi:hypothetical protein
MIFIKIDQESTNFDGPCQFASNVELNGTSQKCVAPLMLCPKRAGPIFLLDSVVFGPNLLTAKPRKNLPYPTLGTVQKGMQQSKNWTTVDLQQRSEFAK